ncbi:MAG: primosomal protein N' [Anaerolineales bacterium]|nr:primosomal protein N' [Anaerolineales bacterium]
MYAEVAVNLPPVRGTFHYHLPPDLEARLQPGHLVIVSFGQQRVQGVVLRLLEQAEVPETKPVLELVEDAPVLTATQLALARWISQTSLTPLIECLTLMVPPGLAQRADTEYRLTAAETPAKTEAEARLVGLLARRGPLRGRQIDRLLPRQEWRRSAEHLVRRGGLQRTPVLDPPKVRPKRVRNARLAQPPHETLPPELALGRPGSAAEARRRRMLEVLVREREPVETFWLYAESGGTLADLHALEERGLVVLSEAEVWRDPLAGISFVAAQAPQLTSDQTAAWERILPHLDRVPGSAPLPVLLHGVTGSGKTEIYLRAVEATLAAGRQAIVLVPEIALTPQTVRRFLARFPGQVGLIHSQLSSGERYDTWRRCRQGALPVVVGPRSALFVPLPSIGLIVVDECHDESYKEQATAPRYHGRETAMAYARLLGAACILGSATPDLDTYFKAAAQQLELVTLPQRILGHRRVLDAQRRRLGAGGRYKPAEADAEYADLPPVTLVDMRKELREGNTSLFSRDLIRALHATLDAQQQAILFLNRRGTATHMFCRDCGWVLRCPRCDVPMAYHSQPGEARCHRCGYRRSTAKVCPNCGGDRVRHFGAGTQQVQAEVERLFPRAQTLRWDRDTAHAPEQHLVILDHFIDHRADVLVGTQMIAKGLDLPLVTLVGVVLADTGLNLPDFRAAERTFQVLSQVAGRAGRSPLGGRVILQTYQPEHYALQAAARHDYAGFYRQELEKRRDLGYPPYRRLVRLVYAHTSSQAAERAAIEMGRRLQARLQAAGGSTELIGPAPCFFERVGGRYRWQVILRGQRPLDALQGPLPEGWQIDVDPVSLL